MKPELKAGPWFRFLHVPQPVTCLSAINKGSERIVCKLITCPGRSGVASCHKMWPGKAPCANILPVPKPATYLSAIKAYLACLVDASKRINLAVNNDLKEILRIRLESLKNLKDFY